MTRGIRVVGCSVDNCDSKHYAFGLCNKHYLTNRKYGDPTYIHPKFRKKICLVSDCQRQMMSRGYCKLHYRPFSLYGDPLARKIANKGEGSINSEGYRVVVAKGHPNAMNKNGLILEHRLVMSEYLGRPLTKTENVHHINGDRADNRIENLELWVVSQPAGKRPADLVAYAKEILNTYSEEVERGII